MTEEAKEVASPPPPPAKTWYSVPTSLNCLSENIRDDALLETELLFLAFATGIQDAATYPDYLAFASNQTGNTIILAVSAAGLDMGDAMLPSVANPLMSLGMFLAGALVLGQLGNYFGCRKRSWLLLTNFLQTAMAFAATAIQYRYPIYVTGSTALIVLALLAFSSGGQVAMARSLKINEITTAMATSAYVDLFVDPQLLRWKNRPRNRRALFLVALFVGSFVGAFAYKKVNSPFVLLLSAVGKFVVMCAFLFNGKMKGRKVEGKS
ncbi:DUF1275 domain protein [Sporormia fimetaria CBS 119925]|uniref:DUF1275 domain protein n=1 Tax=Sporormia fimetaria CBS 119925 TaxID=1340428 RepID=A0A6A6VS47_9PLEO|nr:DUF1275 domain protein [Sporormia fimetaria CBS 119925]